MIVASSDTYEDSVITGIAGKKGFSIINVEKDMMNAEIGFGRRVLEAIENCGLCFEHLPSGIDTMSVLISTADITPVKDRVLDSIQKSVTPDLLSFEDGLALIAVVGRGMVKAKGTAARIFNAMASAGINIRMIDQGSSELNIVVELTSTTLKRLYGQYTPNSRNNYTFGTKNGVVGNGNSVSGNPSIILSASAQRSFSGKT